ncbi:MAG: DegV family EDD domain-containing protein, partial [Oscillospiraceae bacterium]|nr:DegV family EDD domain-containing protein [Oscillospiraceae bacterium]
TYEEIVDWLESEEKAVCHLFTVDNLSYLHKGGRISKTQAIIGATLGIKPLLKLTNTEQELKLYSKVRGRQKSLNQLVEDIKNRTTDNKNEFIFISHADCKDDADYCAKLIKKSYNCNTYIADMTPTIGAHVGPGAVNITFFSKEN